MLQSDASIPFQVTHPDSPDDHARRKRGKRTLRSKWRTNPCMDGDQFAENEINEEDEANRWERAAAAAALSSTPVCRGATGLACSCSGT
uniref:Uncharacterized protein n=1 Tax=Chromera velia CCMP2878 TaxID=1169474 RepID=A0A0G4HPJ9_9ALVE|eukprot:Cvel_29841.t1-p1 / transcript=Cvel_29841.t1 / gene=Cvel_29841 / organism=Chromera_velia_CCMP2878 / gene_product=hypothetical protein / transcript_product=hypothetical protein / location=Cvel_scaffold4159:5144-6399(-) / protein_length=88 / sequence_SO=supercontig / SO=protein_coding / is_pseudo=false